jgi:hypothetical protein
MEVAASGYEFVVLHDAYIIHVPHPDTREKVTFKNNQHYKNISKNTRKEFLYDFRRRYGDDFYITYYSHHHHHHNTSQDQTSSISSSHSSSNDAGGDEDVDKGSCGGDNDNDNGSCSSNQNSGNILDPESEAIIDSMMDSMVAYN